MKAILVRQATMENSSIYFSNNEYDYFYNPLHFHPELELTLIVRSNGHRWVGDSFDSFMPGDIVLVGSNLPHIWKNDPLFYGDDHQKAESVTIKFLPNFAGDDFFNRPEMAKIRNLIDTKSSRGIKLIGALRNKVEQIMVTLPTLSEAGYFISLLHILQLISESDDCVSLSSIEYYNCEQSIKDVNRINVALNYIIENYKERIHLDDIANVVHMNKNAFCRFFKEHTGKSLFTMIGEIRIDKSRRYLLETTMDIQQISLECGFNNLSHFNKRFKKISGVTPSEYRSRLSDGANR